MAGVIRTALDAHQPGYKDGHAMCRNSLGCRWMVPDGCQDDWNQHLAEVATAAVLEVAQLVLEGWLMTHEAPRAQLDMAAADMAAALAGEG